MLDDIDRGLIEALQINGRASFTVLGAVLGVSTQTVARRYRRLRATAGLRVVGLADPQHGGIDQWMVRLTAGPHAAQDIGMALARRPDTSWVKLTSGGTEIFAVIRVPIGDIGDHPLLLRDIPRTAGITAVSAHLMVHTYLGGPTTWRGHTGVLDEQQKRRLVPLPCAAAATRPDDDNALLAALQRDGRAGLTDLSKATGATPATVARRLADLQAARAIFFDVEVDAALLGASTMALLWMSVAPAHLDVVAGELAEHDELAVVAATTGPTNLMAQAMCADAEALHRYLTRRLGALDAIRMIETAPILRTLKATSPITIAERDGCRPPRLSY